MKCLINKTTGVKARLKDDEARKLVDAGTHNYISKSEYESTPGYLGDSGGNATHWVDVNSSNIHSVRYIRDTQTLQIKFGQPKITSMYNYDNVPESMFNDMLKAESKGKWFWANIRQEHDKYPYYRVW